ncbi:hypothetical protein LRS10_21555 [Phenylobacterium sp. J426]|uniref:hypothetical protein n=1 Tax=Phenylobacterium sp. J426 TaxID=2898439 RepID=UPI002150F355|nr:hypothetical protein [Phenylobacterium sp. J426]MCR5876500.1 hypothetical protein [Phenylobacterium sp. J426]
MVLAAVATQPGQFRKVGLAAKQGPRRPRRLERQQAMTRHRRAGTAAKQADLQRLVRNRRADQEVEVRIAAMPGQGLEQFEVGDILAKGLGAKIEARPGMEDRQARIHGVARQAWDE